MNVEVTIVGNDKLFAVAERTQQHLKKLDEAAKQTAKSQEGILRLQRQLTDFQGQQQKAAYERLNLEQKIAVVKERQVRLDQQLARSGQGTVLRQGLELKGALNSAQLAELMRQKDESDRVSLKDLLLPAAIASRIGMIKTLSKNAALKRMLPAALPFAALGATVGVLGKVTGAAMDDAGEIRGLAGQTGLDLVRAQKLRYGAAAAGADLGQMSMLLSTLRMNIGQALNGSQEMAEAFERFGISIKDLQSANVLELFVRIANEFERGGRNAMQFAAGAKVLGESFKVSSGAAIKTAQLAGGAADEGMIPTTDLAALGDLSAAVKKGMADAGGWLKRKVAKVGAATVSAMRMAKYLGYSKWYGSQEDRDALLERIVTQTEGIDTKGTGTQEMLDRLAERQRTRGAANTSSWEDYQALLAKDQADAAAKGEAAAPQAGGVARGGQPMAADALARIGLFRGGIGGQVGLARQQLDRLEQIRAELQGLRREVTAE